jgi:transposase
VPVIIDRLTGKTRRAQIFVAVMGASNFTYAEASWTQALGDWIGVTRRALLEELDRLRLKPLPSEP